MNKLSFMGNYKLWSKENKQHGKYAFSRFVMLYFLESIEKVSEEFIFKGGNLLWHYIKTPRSTVDLDLSTLTIKNHKTVKDILAKICSNNHEVEFEVLKFTEIDDSQEIGSKVIIKYKTNQGQENKFSVDIVYALPTDISKVKSTISKIEYKAASIENIIADKLQASFRFRGGNTRMKDFDDLWRISNADISIDKKKVKILLETRGIPHALEKDWTTFLQKNWKGHTLEYSDLPKNIEEVFLDINKWLSQLVG
jgi:hypothetical protein